MAAFHVEISHNSDFIENIGFFTYSIKLWRKTCKLNNIINILIVWCDIYFLILFSLIPFPNDLLFMCPKVQQYPIPLFFISPLFFFQRDNNVYNYFLLIWILLRYMGHLLYLWLNFMLWPSTWWWRSGWALRIIKFCVYSTN